MASVHVVPTDAHAEISAEGPLDLPRSRELVLRVAGDAGAAGKDLLVDVRGVSSTLTYSDVFQLVRLLRQHPDAFRGRIALLDDYDDGFELAQFFEASATEFGFRVRAFVDAAEAADWLAA